LLINLHKKGGKKFLTVTTNTRVRKRRHHDVAKNILERESNTRGELRAERKEETRIIRLKNLSSFSDRFVNYLGVQGETKEKGHGKKIHDQKSTHQRERG